MKYYVMTRCYMAFDEPGNVRIGDASCGVPMDIESATKWANILKIDGADYGNPMDIWFLPVLYGKPDLRIV
jgi:hypothetical protein